MVISNHNSFRVRFDKIASVYFIWKYINILALEMAIPGNRYCANCIARSVNCAALLLYNFPVVSMLKWCKWQPSLRPPGSPHPSSAWWRGVPSRLSLTSTAAAATSPCSCFLWHGYTGSLSFSRVGKVFVCFSCLLGFAGVQDRQKVEGFPRQSTRAGFHTFIQLHWPLLESWSKSISQGPT